MKVRLYVDLETDSPEQEDTAIAAIRAVEHVTNVEVFFRKTDGQAKLEPKKETKPFSTSEADLPHNITVHGKKEVKELFGITPAPKPKEEVKEQPRVETKPTPLPPATPRYAVSVKQVKPSKVWWYLDPVNYRPLFVFESQDVVPYIKNTPSLSPRNAFENDAYNRIRRGEKPIVQEKWSGPSTEVQGVINKMVRELTDEGLELFNLLAAKRLQPDQFEIWTPDKP